MAAVVEAMDLAKEASRMHLMAITTSMYQTQEVVETLEAGGDLALEAEAPGNSSAHLTI